MRETPNRRNPRLTEKARQLRPDSTIPERRLWSRLRDRRFGNAKFRRQYTIGPYLVDFCCSDHRLVLEIDGHSHDTTASYDIARERFLRQAGFEVVRISNDQVLRDMDHVLTTIENALRCCKSIRKPSPLPLSLGKGEGNATS